MVETLEDSLADLAISGDPLPDANLGRGSPGELVQDDTPPEPPAEPPMASIESRPESQVAGEQNQLTEQRTEDAQPRNTFGLRRSSPIEMNAWPQFPNTSSDLQPRGQLPPQHPCNPENHPERRPAILPILVSNGQMSTHDVPSPNDVRCGRCGSTVEKSRARMKAKHCQTWICNVCNCKCVQLARYHGKWPTDEFKGLSKEDQEKFYSDIAKDKSGTELHKVSVEFLEKYNRLP